MNRKDQHIQKAEMFYKDTVMNDFDNIKFIHHSFPEIDYKDVDIKTSFSEFTMEQPFFINAMTGGSEATKRINEQLAIVAKNTNLAIASGSLSSALDNPEYISSFKIIREINKTGLVFANIDAERSVEDAKKAIDILNANALQIHVNAPQELIYPNGDRDFSMWLKNIEQIVKNVSIPVIVKEVGFGMSSKTVKRLIDIGVKIIDVSGRGGTNFAKIEDYTNRYYYLHDYGQTTVFSLLDNQDYIEKINFIAYGGIRNPLDVVKALALGAKAVGISGYFLHLVLKESIDKVIMEINNWKEQIISLMTLLGKKKVSDLIKTDLVLTGELRGIFGANYLIRT